MTEQEKNDVLLAVRAQLSGDLQKDIAMIEEKAKQYEAQEGGKETADALVELAYSILPDEQTAYMKRTLYIGDKRLDHVYADAMALTKAGKTARSLELTEKLYKHILEQFPETDDTRIFSFRNLLESNLYQLLYHPTKKLLKAPFDFTLFIGAHAYNLVEVRRLEEAVTVLQEAIRYNPVNPDPRFELAEVYKLMQQDEKLLETVCETLPICSSGYAIGRCYANLGYYCVNIKDYKSAVAFYYESVMFADHPAIAGELRHIEQLTGHPVIPPTREMINAAFAEHHIYHGPGRELLYTARELAKQAQEGERWEEAMFYLRVVNSLIKDPEAEKALQECRKKLD